MLFTTAGDYQIQAKVVNFTEVVCSSATRTINVNGKWLITVELTADRYQFGLLTLYDASGAEVSHAKCLGRSRYNRPMTEENGNTPIGVYKGYLFTHDKPAEQCGPYKVVVFEAISGYIVEHCGHRSGIWIHGGREQYYDYGNITEDDPGFALCPTGGCIRVTNAYQLQLQNEITALIAANHERNGVVIVTQDGQTSL